MQHKSVQISLPGNPLDCFFPIRFQKTWFLTILKKKTALERFFPNPNAFLRPV